MFDDKKISPEWNFRRSTFLKEPYLSSSSVIIKFASTIELEKFISDFLAEKAAGRKVSDIETINNLPQQIQQNFDNQISQAQFEEQKSKESQLEQLKKHLISTNPVIAEVYRNLVVANQIITPDAFWEQYSELLATLAEPVTRPMKVMAAIDEPEALLNESDFLKQRYTALVDTGLLNRQEFFRLLKSSKLYHSIYGLPEPKLDCLYFDAPDLTKDDGTKQQKLTAIAANIINPINALNETPNEQQTQISSRENVMFERFNEFGVSYIAEVYYNDKAANIDTFTTGLGNNSELVLMKTLTSDCIKEGARNDCSEKLYKAHKEELLRSVYAQLPITTELQEKSAADINVIKDEQVLQHKCKSEPVNFLVDKSLLTRLTNSGPPSGSSCLHYRKLSNLYFTKEIDSIVSSKEDLKLMQKVMEVPALYDQIKKINTISLYLQELYYNLYSEIFNAKDKDLLKNQQLYENLLRIRRSLENIAHTQFSSQIYESLLHSVNINGLSLPLLNSISKLVNRFEVNYYAK